MSELKAGTIKTPYREGIAFVVDDTFYDKEEGETLFYLKSEADKVIAELEQNLSEIQSQNMQLEDDVALLRHNNAELKKACDSKDDWCLHTLKETRHQKHKRCLAMAWWCASRVVVWTTDGNEKKSDWYWKWKERWKNLAEKFKDKEAK